ncbi:hypothetical protein ACQ3HR_09820 [Staphylococcus cohnii]|uniref:hypothetical protein n=2 Tax=Staphylococcus TaxID=1279 RepID=UPI000D1EF60F|nr:hypothetical protein [Staphylococcus nepalensis]AWI43322.1 hypothetical protein BJG88_00205 [Staphylococcus nepalensis]PTI80348.1 hypothetical protein BU064_01785 [Staphylococcus succinus]
MNVIVLAHNITDEREAYLDEPIDTVRAYCKEHSYKITKDYNDDNQLINDIKLKHVKPKRIVFWGIYEDYPKLVKLCSTRGIELITIFPMLV